MTMAPATVRPSPMPAVGQWSSIRWKSVFVVDSLLSVFVLVVFPHRVLTPVLTLVAIVVV